MAKIKTPRYFKWRDGRPCWEPGPRLRAQGWKRRDFKDASGNWMAIGDAFSAADAINQQVDDWRAGKATVNRPARTRTYHTVRDLYARYVDSPKFNRLGTNTQKDYIGKLGVFLGEFGDTPLLVLEHHHIYNFYERLFAERGHAMANAVIACARAMLSYAPKIGFRKDNPALKLDLVTVPPRVVTWSDPETNRFMEICKAHDLHACRRVTITALHTAQRKGDILCMREATIGEHRIDFLQSKRGQRVSVPLTEQLATVIDECRSARPNNAPAALFLDSDGASYTRQRLRRDFEFVRPIVAETFPDFADKTFGDTRDTAITRLALADCSISEIRSISGHKLKTVTTILEHYIANDAKFADGAIQKLSDYLKKEGIKI